MLKAGDLAQRVSVQLRTETSDGHDGYTESWATTHRRVSARVRPLVGRDLERARQTDPRASHEVTLRFWRAYQADLDGGRVRLVYHPTSASADDRTFEIVGAPIDLEEAHEALQLVCKEAV